MTTETPEVENTTKTPTAATALKETFTRDYVEDLREESKSVRLKLREAETKLQEAEKAKADLEASHQDNLTKAETKARNDIAFARLESIAIKAGLNDPDDLAKFLDASALEFDDAGKLKEGAALIEKLKSDKPYLFGSANTSSTAKKPVPGEVAVKKVTEMTAEEKKAHYKKLGL